MKKIFLLLVFSLSLYADTCRLMAYVGPYSGLDPSPQCYTRGYGSTLYWSGTSISICVNKYGISKNGQKSYSCVDSNNTSYSYITGGGLPSSCSNGYIWDSNSSSCFKPCLSNQHKNSKGECVSNCTFTPPSNLKGYPFLKHFNSSDVAVKYFNVNSIQNGLIQSANALGAPSSCSGFYAYGNLPNDINNTNSCKSVHYLSIIDGFPYQSLFATMHGCEYYINHKKGGFGVCKQYNNCSLVFAYYNDKNNSIKTPDFNTTSDINTSFDNVKSVDTNNSNFDTNFTSPNHTIDTNNSSNISPLLGQIKQLSNNNHYDMGKLFQNTNIINHNLNTLINLMSASSNKLSAIKVFKY